MTHRLNPLSPLDCLYDCAQSYPGGIEALAGRMRMPSSTLYKKLCSHTETHKLTLDEAERLMRFFDEAQLPGASKAIEALAYRHGRVCIRLPEPEQHAGDLATQVVAVFKEGGDVATAVSQAIQDGRLTQRERIVIEAEIEQAVSALMGLLVMVGRDAK